MAQADHDRSQQQTDPKATAPAPTTFSTPSALSPFSISPADFLADRPDIHSLIAGAAVFRPSRSASGLDREWEILLLRRSPGDSFPLRWEIPAGTMEPAVDRSITAVAVRELWEETGLRASRLTDAVGLGLAEGTSTSTSTSTSTVAREGGEEVQDARMDPELNMCLLRVSGLTWAIATFMAELENDEADVVLRKDEHVEWAWVAEDEVRAGRRAPGDAVGQRLELVSEAMRMLILEAFNLKRRVADVGE